MCEKNQWYFDIFTKKHYVINLFVTLYHYIVIQYTMDISRKWNESALSLMCVTKLHFQTNEYYLKRRLT